MHNKEISLVEVGVFVWKKGQEIDTEFLGNELNWSYPNWEECVEDLPEEKEKSIFRDNDAVFIQDCYGFIFNFVGEGYDSGIVSGLHWDYSEGLQNEMFEEYEGDFIKIANQKLDEYKKKQEFLRNSNYDVNFVRFITAWEWTSYEDTYYNEWNSEWNMLGLVDLNNIQKSIKGINE